LASVAVIICLCDMWYDPWLCDQMESFVWCAPWLCDQMESFVWCAPWLCDQMESFVWCAPWLGDQLELVRLGVVLTTKQIPLKG
ncbi:hypothetical protein Tco_1512875, partial [Tanacetum coccineum]